MDRGSILKWLFVGLAVFLFLQFGAPILFGKGGNERQPLGIDDQTAPAVRAEEQTCVLEGPRFQAELSTRGASLTHYRLTDPKYARLDDGKPLDLVSTARESRMALRTDLRAPSDVKQQVAYDDVDWRLTGSDGKSCTFTYLEGPDGKPVSSPDQAATVVTKTIRTTDKPYELSVSLKVENLANEPRTHRLAFEQTAYRTAKETEGKLGTISEWQTEAVTSTKEATEHLMPDAFEPGDFEDKEFTPEKWRRTPGEAKWVAVSSSYFTQLAIPIESPAAPAAEAQIEEVWDAARFQDKKADPAYGHVYRARLAYPEKELAPKASATYEVLVFMGPKERELLAAIGHDAHEVIKLGWFAGIARLLVSYLYVLKGLVGSWGWAIVLLTVTVRILLAPLSLSQIRSGLAMRRLKPEMDAINAKYKDDPTQKALAIQELWRKNGVTNPVLGCFPVLLQMPVWFALYTALQTAVELYHTPFGPFIPDLSAPGKYFIIPIVLGASSFIQQKLMPMQGDPAQQKMMLYMMPAIFTVMMLFLPAGLGVYMLTNTWLGIGQQLLVEKYYQSRARPDVEVREKKATLGDETGSAPALGKGKARVRG